MVQDFTYSTTVLYLKDSAAPSHCEAKKFDAFQVGVHNILNLHCLWQMNICG